MSKIKNGGLDQYGAGPFEQQQFETAGVERVNANKDVRDITAYAMCDVIIIACLFRETLSECKFSDN